MFYYLSSKSVKYCFTQRRCQVWRGDSIVTDSGVVCYLPVLPPSEQHVCMTVASSSPVRVAAVD